MVWQAVTESPDDHGVFITLFENVDPKSAKASPGNSEVTLRVILEGISLIFIHHTVGDDCDFTWQHGSIGNLIQGAMKLGGRRCADTVIKVRALLIYKNSQAFFKFYLGHWLTLLLADRTPGSSPAGDGGDLG